MPRKKVRKKSQTFKAINTVISVQKVDNPILKKNWRYELQCVQESNDNRDIEYVRLLFHGTSSMDPSCIYASPKGWKVNYASDKNLWGRGIYFAQDASYCCGKYCYTTKKGTQVLLLAAVIVGDDIVCDENKALRDPPIEEGLKRFDSVSGMRHGTWVWVVYENARAYPLYVIEFAPSQKELI